MLTMHRDTRYLSACLAIVAFIAATMVASSAHCKSIGRNNFDVTDKIKSPDRRFELVNDCVKEPKNSGSHSCSIFLKDSKSGRKKLLYVWDRDISWNGSIDTFWSPSSKAVILTNYVSTNTGESVLFILEPGIERVNLSDVILGANPPKLHVDDIHAYSAATWLDANTIRLKLTGHHDSPPAGGFTYTYIYEVREHSSRLSKHVEHCDEDNDQC